MVLGGSIGFGGKNVDNGGVGAGLGSGAGDVLELDSSSCRSTRSSKLCDTTGGVTIGIVGVGWLGGASPVPVQGVDWVLVAAGSAERALPAVQS